MTLVEDYVETADCEEVAGANDTLSLARCSSGPKNTDMEPWSPTWSELCDELSKASVGDKDGPYYVRGACSSPRGDESMPAGATLLLIDGDKSVDPVSGEIVDKCVPPEDAHEALRSMGLPHLIHTSYSHNPEQGINKWRGILECPMQTRGELHAMSNWIIDQLNERGVPIIWVKEMSAMSQPWFFPRLRSDDSQLYVARYDLEEGEEHPLSRELVERVTAEWKAKGPTIEAGAERGSERDGESPIGRFMKKFDNADFITGLLEEHAGCSLVGSDVVNGKLAYRLVPPDSTTGAAGVHVYRGKNDGTWLVFSHNASFEMPMKAMDAFGVFQWLVHDNDQTAALADAKRMVAEADGDLSYDTASELIEAALEIESERDRANALKDLAKQISASSLIDHADQGALLKRIAKHAGFAVSDLRKDVKKAAPKAEGQFMRNMEGQIINNAFNTSKAMQFSISGKHIAYDEFRDEILFHEGDGVWKPFRDNHYHQIRISLDLLGFERTSADMVKGAVGDVALENKFDWAIDWLRNDVPEWDRVPRVAKFCANYLGCKDDKWAEAVSVYTWTAMAGRALVPGIKADMMPVWISPEGLLKSSAISCLVPDEAFFSEMSFHEPEVDRTRKMRGCLVAEISELAGMNAKEVESVKAWVSKRFEEWTPKYKEFAARMGRRLVFIGTTNRTEFLVSETGNRRFLPISITGCDTAKVAADRNQLWAEARTMFEINGVMWQTAQQLASGIHEEHMVREPWADKLAVWMDEPFIAVNNDFDEAPKKGSKNCDREFLANVDLYRAIGIMPDRQTSGTDRILARAMQQLGWEKKRKGREYNRVSGFEKKKEDFSDLS